MEIFLGAFTAEWEQRKAAFLHDLSLGRRPFEDDDERRRRSGSVAAAQGARGLKVRGFLLGHTYSNFSCRSGARRPADRPMRARFAGLAAGSQPAVVKMASFGGGARLGAMINYVSRNGEVVVENERGDQLRGRDQLSAVGGEWDHLMKNRAESRDIGLFKISIGHAAGADGEFFERGREIVSYALGGRAFAFAVAEQTDATGFEIQGVAVLRDRHGERLTGDDKATTIVQKRLEAARSGERDIRFQFTGYGNGTDYGASRVRRLVENYPGRVQDEQGRPVMDARRAGELVQQEWRDQLHSRKPRDVMHLIISARASTDTVAFQDAARDFLGSQFGGHRYAFSLHDASSDPKAEAAGGKRPHVHVHAIVAMRSDAGDRIETTIPAFRQWRLAMAEKARAHGVDMEMTDRRDRASPPSYTKNQVRPLNTIGRTVYEGTTQAADFRYRSKRADVPFRASTARSQIYMQAAREEWRNVLNYGAFQIRPDFVNAQIARLEDRRSSTAVVSRSDRDATNSASQFRTQLVKLSELVSEGEDMHHMTRSEFGAYEKRVETALFQAERAISSDNRKDFEEIAAAAREHVAARRELMEFTEEQTSKLPAPRESLSRTADREDEQRRWSDAVERHGIDAAAAANKALVDIERVRGAIEQLHGREQIDDGARTLKEELRLQLSKAAELGASGNALIRDAAEMDAELKSAILNAERERRFADRDKREGSGATDAAARPARNDAKDSVVQDRVTVGGASASEREAARTEVEGSGDTTKEDPAKQHVPRLEELQRQAEHDRDDRER
ncbi:MULTISPECIES: conjugal transfer protein TraA [unclassified Neorhizobium]|uniref:conjugal transfer protein TraA n=1 Tax=unclassified Neorhizobium TaxID=2629175 RepID=UPI001FF6C8FE|nr:MULTISPECIES: conjugal transfer protein TraA [unclassified Neorhizobium]MCJ9674019.1 conjugal transfer protein TraA [Neorhizobium sp. SHOUNA12B]MCJ9748891.1 conjugal transfer protein TraA [Neorhizobium sp. SHOUNA12A]